MAAAAMSGRCGGGDLGGMRLEHLRMYGVIERLAAEIDQLLPQLRRGAPHLADHALRAVEAALFNTAEGAGSHKPGVKTAAYDTARKELSELRAVLRRAISRRCVRAPEVARADEYAGIAIAMLTNAIRSVERRANEPRRPATNDP